jgi:hypothetical protein
MARIGLTPGWSSGSFAGLIARWATLRRVDHFSIVGRVMVAVSVTSLLGACRLHLAPADSVLRRHAVFVGSEGNAKHALTEAQAKARDIDTDEPMAGAEYRAYVDSIIAAMRAGNRDTILLYIHGGRVGLQSGATESMALLAPISASGYYPLFIVWDASQWTSLGWHLGRYHRGLDYKGVGRVFMPPFQLASDLVTGIGRSPFTLAHQTADLCRGVMGVIRRGGEPSDASCPLVGPDREERKRLRRIEGPTRAASVAARGANRGNKMPSPENPARTRDPLTVSWGEYHLPWYEQTYRGITGLLYLPIKLPIGVLLDGLGTGAWDDMVRRTTAMFRPGSELRGADIAGELPPGRTPSGAAGVLLEAIQRMTAKDSADGTRKWSVILAAHSMGAIVGNRILREYPNLPIDRIQYMAAASSIADVESSVIPHLRRRKTATFQLGTLQPFAEAGELQTSKWGWILPDVFIPRGSLLEWIDDYLENSRSPFDRRAGKWRNVALGLHLFPDSVRSRVTIKAFGVRDPIDSGTLYEKHPARHGEFNDAKLGFWCRDYWRVTRDGTAPVVAFGVWEVKTGTELEQPGCPPIVRAR